VGHVIMCDVLCFIYLLEWIGVSGCHSNFMRTKCTTALSSSSSSSSWLQTIIVPMDVREIFMYFSEHSHAAN
jgi:hypothetical protein